MRCGAARHTGSAGKITNCQIGVFATYASRRGRSSHNRALYLLKSWTDHPIRLEVTHVQRISALRRSQDWRHG